MWSSHHALFQSITARSAGLSTIDPSMLREVTQFFLILLMFIGAGLGSTGGIRVMTFAILIGASGSFLSILFEATSAYCTVGMSTGLTSHLSEPGKIIIILLMFVGRIGPVTLAFALNTRSKKELYRYPEGKITIG